MDQEKSRGKKSMTTGVVRKRGKSTNEKQEEEEEEEEEDEEEEEQEMNCSRIWKKTDVSVLCSPWDTARPRRTAPAGAQLTTHSSQATNGDNYLWGFTLKLVADTCSRQAFVQLHSMSMTPGRTQHC